MTRGVFSQQWTQLCNTILFITQFWSWSKFLISPYFRENNSNVLFNNYPFLATFDFSNYLFMLSFTLLVTLRSRSPRLEEFFSSCIYVVNLNILRDIALKLSRVIKIFWNLIFTFRQRLPRFEFVQAFK